MRASRRQQIGLIMGPVLFLLVLAAPEPRAMVDAAR
jgi:hypothetical protein